MDFRPDILSGIVLALVLMAAAVSDIRSGQVPNSLCYGAIALAAVLSLASAGFGGLVSMAAGLAVGFGPLFVCWLLGGVGGGDVKLMAAVGALTNWRFVLLVLAMSLIVTFMWAAIVMLRRGIFLRTWARVFRTLYLAAVTKGKSGWAPEDEKTPKLPFAFAVLLGAFAAHVDLSMGGVVSRAILGW